MCAYGWMRVCSVLRDRICFCVFANATELMKSKFTVLTKIRRVIAARFCTAPLHIGTTTAAATIIEEVCHFGIHPRVAHK